MDVWEILNSVYGPMFQRVQILGRKLAIAGYNAKWGWYNLHATRRGDEYKVELFPIPVINVGKWCDIIMELDSFCIDAHLTKPMDLPLLLRTLEDLTGKEEEEEGEKKE